MLFCRFFSKEFCKRFRKDPNTNIQSAIPLPKDVTDSENGWLTRDVIVNEIWAVFQHIGPFKAPGLDGMPASFYEKCWNVIAKSIFNVIRAFLHYGHLLKELNNTHNTLFLKWKTLLKLRILGLLVF